MALSVPKAQIDLLKQFIQLSEDQVAELIHALASAGPQFNVADLAAAVTERVKLPEDLVNGMVRVLGTLYLTKESQNLPTEVFVRQEVFPALLNAELFTGDVAPVSYTHLPSPRDA